jgi:hypothetical protein
MKITTMLFIEVGMLSCVILAAFLVPGRTPLWGFLAVSSEFLLIGNYLLVKAVEHGKAKEDAVEEHKWRWSRIFGIFVILNFPWVVSQLLSNGK